MAAEVVPAITSTGVLSCKPAALRTILCSLSRGQIGSAPGGPLDAGRDSSQFPADQRPLYHRKLLSQRGEKKRTKTFLNSHDSVHFTRRHKSLSCPIGGSTRPSSLSVGPAEPGNLHVNMSTNARSPSSASPDESSERHRHFRQPHGIELNVPRALPLQHRISRLRDSDTAAM